MLGFVFGPVPVNLNPQQDSLSFYRESIQSMLVLCDSEGSKSLTLSSMINNYNGWSLDVECLHLVQCIVTWAPSAINIENISFVESNINTATLLSDSVKNSLLGIGPQRTRLFANLSTMKSSMSSTNNMWDSCRGTFFLSIHKNKKNDFDIDLSTD